MRFGGQQSAPWCIDRLAKAHSLFSYCHPDDRREEESRIPYAGSLYTWKLVFQPFTPFTLALFLALFGGMVNRVKGLGAKFYVYTRAWEDV